MAGNLQTKYGTSNQAITCTITSLASAAYRASTAVDNSTNVFVDALVTVKVKSNASGVSATGTVVVYAYGSTDTTSYDGAATGTDAAYTPPTTPTNLTPIMILNLNANAVTDQRTASIASAFGGSLPTKWGIVVQNNSGAALDASVGSSWYQGIYGQYT